MSLFKNIIQSIHRSKQREVLSHLQRMTERQLIDCGFSPELVAEGIKAWPWRINNTAPEPLALDSKLLDEQKIVRKLQRFSNAELSDLGVSRGDIPDVVRNGRSGIERHSSDEAA